MSTTRPPAREDEADNWARLAEHADFLRELAQNDDRAFQARAQRLLDGLEERGYL